jgi:hypothetical protein
MREWVYPEVSEGMHEKGASSIGHSLLDAADVEYRAMLAQPQPPGSHVYQPRAIFPSCSVVRWS